MKLDEIIEEYGPIIGARADVDTLVAFDEEKVIHVFVGDQNGDYTHKEEYDTEIDGTNSDAMFQEGQDVLDDFIDGGEGDES